MFPLAAHPWDLVQIPCATSCHAQTQDRITLNGPKEYQPDRYRVLEIAESREQSAVQGPFLFCLKFMRSVLMAGSEKVSSHHDVIDSTRPSVSWHGFPLVSAGFRKLETRNLEVNQDDDIPTHSHYLDVMTRDPLSRNHYQFSASTGKARWGFG